MPTNLRFHSTVAVYLLILLGWMVAAGGPVLAEQLSAELQPLAYRLGTWTAAVEWLDASGEVTRIVPSVMQVRRVLGGHALEQKGRLVGTQTEVIAIVFVDAESRRITEIGIGAPGRLDVLHPTFEQDRVIFTAEPKRRGGQTVIFRAIDSAFQPDRYETTGWISIDNGKTWRQTFDRSITISSRSRNERRRRSVTSERARAAGLASLP